MHVSNITVRRATPGRRANCHHPVAMVLSPHGVEQTGTGNGPRAAEDPCIETSRNLDSVQGAVRAGGAGPKRCVP